MLGLLNSLWSNKFGSKAEGGLIHAILSGYDFFLLKSHIMSTGRLHVLISQISGQYSQRRDDRVSLQIIHVSSRLKLMHILMF